MSPTAQSGRAGSGCLDEVDVDVYVRREDEDVVEDDCKRRGQEQEKKGQAWKATNSSTRSNDKKTGRRTTMDTATHRCGRGFVGGCASPGATTAARRTRCSSHVGVEPRTICFIPTHSVGLAGVVAKTRSTSARPMRPRSPCSSTSAFHSDAAVAIAIAR